MKTTSAISSLVVPVIDDFEFTDAVVSIKKIDDKAYAVVYDSGTGSILRSVVDYSIFLSEILLSNPLTVEAVVLAVARYRSFLVSKARLENKKSAYEFHESTDDLLRSFRSEEAERVIARPSARHDEYTAKRTVNAKLVHIYHFLNWYQDVTQHKGFFGGKNGLVTTSLKSEDVRSRPRNGEISSARARYPLLFRRVGARSLGPRGYIATESDREKLADYFGQNFTSYVAVRNTLIMDIADQMGWRRGAINSLVCEDFSEERLDSMPNRGIACIPKKQKGGYRDSFYIKPALAINIAAFINDTREVLIAEMGWAHASKKGPVFLSARNGKELTDKAISKVFGTAFAAIGAPKGSGIHSFRRKFAGDATGAETLARLELGLDTSSASVASAVSMDLGHRNPESIRSYVGASQTRLASRKRNP